MVQPRPPAPDPGEAFTADYLTRGNFVVYAHRQPVMMADKAEHFGRGGDIWLKELFHLIDYSKYNNHNNYKGKQEFRVYELFVSYRLSPDKGGNELDDRFSSAEEVV